MKNRFVAALAPVGREIRQAFSSRSLGLCVCVAIMLSLAPGLRAAEPVKLIFDTDMDSDCDDAAALAIVHALADAGEVEILATPVSSKYEWSAVCVDAINTYFGRGDLPVGIPKQGPKFPQQRSRYAKQIAQEFPHDLPYGEKVPDAAPIYRRVLAAQTDNSVVIVTVGDLTNLRYLLESKADDISPLDGPALVKRKVRQWVCMGTRYPHDLDPGHWGNFKVDPESTVKAIAGWPTLITFTGGQEFAEKLATGKAQADLPRTNPVRRVYELYFGGQVKPRHSADQIAVMVAVRGPGKPWKLVTEGYNHIFPNGTHEWRTQPNNPLHQYVSALADGVEYRDVADMMEKLMLHQPKKK